MVPMDNYEELLREATIEYSNTPRIFLRLYKGIYYNLIINVKPEKDNVPVDYIKEILQRARDYLDSGIHFGQPMTNHLYDTIIDNTEYHVRMKINEIMHEERITSFGNTWIYSPPKTEITRTQLCDYGHKILGETSDQEEEEETMDETIMKMIERLSLNQE